jgi:hypothetical protein
MVSEEFGRTEYLGLFGQKKRKKIIQRQMILQYLCLSKKRWAGRNTE